MRHHQKLFATPAHDQVTVAQRGAQAAGGFHQYGVAGGVAVAVIDALEVVDVDQQQRAFERRPCAPRRGLPHAVQVVAVGQAGERIVLTDRAQQRVALLQCQVVAAQPVQQQAGHGHQQQRGQRSGGPQPLGQGVVQQPGLLQGVFTLQQFQLALPALVVLALLQLEDGLLLVAPRHLIGQRALALVGAHRLAQVAGALQIAADLALEAGHAVDRAHPLVQGHGLAGVTQALLGLAPGDQRQADVGQRHRLGTAVAQRAGQRQGLARQPECGVEIAALEVVIGQVGQAQHRQLA